MPREPVEPGLAHPQACSARCRSTRAGCRAMPRATPRPRAVLEPDPHRTVPAADPLVISTFSFLGELVLAVWLVVRGGRVQLGADHEAWNQTRNRPPSAAPGPGPGPCVRSSTTGTAVHKFSASGRVPRPTVGDDQNLILVHAAGGGPRHRAPDDRQAVRPAARLRHPPSQEPDPRSRRRRHHCRDRRRGDRVCSQRRGVRRRARVVRLVRRRHPRGGCTQARQPQLRRGRRGCSLGRHRVPGTH